jgi:hypothetical protein
VGISVGANAAIGALPSEESLPEGEVSGDGVSSEGVSGEGVSSEGVSSEGVSGEGVSSEDGNGTGAAAGADEGAGTCTGEEAGNDTWAGVSAGADACAPMPLTACMGHTPTVSPDVPLNTQQVLRILDAAAANAAGMPTQCQDEPMRTSRARSAHEHTTCGVLLLLSTMHRPGNARASTASQFSFWKATTRNC